MSLSGVTLLSFTLVLFYSLYLDAQVGGLVTSLTHRGNPLNFTLSPVADETDLYAPEAGEWRLMFNRQCQFTEYLGNQDKDGYYFGISHKVTVDRVKEARTRRWRGLDIFYTTFVSGFVRFGTETGPTQDDQRKTTIQTNLCRWTSRFSNIDRY